MFSSVCRGAEWSGELRKCFQLIGYCGSSLFMKKLHAKIWIRNVWIRLCNANYFQIFLYFENIHGIFVVPLIKINLQQRREFANSYAAVCVNSLKWNVYRFSYIVIISPVNLIITIQECSVTWLRITYWYGEPCSLHNTDQIYSVMAIFESSIVIGFF